MKNKGIEYLNNLRLTSTPDSTIFADVKDMDEPYIRLSHANEAAIKALNGAYSDIAIQRTKTSVFMKNQISEAIEAAMIVQDFIWGETSFMNDNYFDQQELVAIFQKRVDKIGQLDLRNPSWKIELRKRLLQQAALSIQALGLLEKI